jgi:hypothetical protein
MLRAGHVPDDRRSYAINFTDWLSQKWLRKRAEYLMRLYEFSDLSMKSERWEDLDRVILSYVGPKTFSAYNTYRENLNL